MAVQRVTGTSTAVYGIRHVGLKACACLDSVGSFADSWPCGSYYAESYGLFFIHIVVNN